MMITRSTLIALFCCNLLLHQGTFTSSTAVAAPPNFLQIFRKTQSVNADVDAKYVLTEEDGPWMILASTCVGEGSKARAERLAFEIRRDLKLPAFIYHESFDFTGSVGKSQRGDKKLRYANEYEYEAYAVLVGEYDHVDHESVDRDLKVLKTARLPIFDDKAEVAKETSTASPVTTVKALTRKFTEYRRDKTLGPMASAFVTRNPMLPEEYFSAPQVDSFVSQLNEDMQYSLLTNKGKFTVVVATFTGLATIVDGKKEKEFEPSGERLAKMAYDVDKMTKQLRKDGVEAYQFHDRNRSLVTIGSFDSLGRDLPDGGYEYTPEIRAVMEKYRAFNPQVAAYDPSGKGIRANHSASIPFDVSPSPIAVPRTSKRSLYSGSFGMK